MSNNFSHHNQGGDVGIIGYSGGTLSAPTNWVNDNHCDGCGVCSRSR